jgi:DNA-binding MarR family transcriptional regulator
MSNNSAEPSEPDAFRPEELAAWRGLLRLHESVTRELDARLRAEHRLSVADYGVLITLLSAPDRRLRMGDLALRRNLTPSGITRNVERLEQDGLIKRETDHSDGRAYQAALTPQGLTRLRQAQVTHHRVVRQRFLERLPAKELKSFAELLERALPGVISADTWPPHEHPDRPGEPRRRARRNSRTTASAWRDRPDQAGRYSSS